MQVGYKRGNGYKQGASGVMGRVMSEVRARNAFSWVFHSQRNSRQHLFVLRVKPHTYYGSSESD